MSEALISKVQHYTRLSSDDVQTLESACRSRARRIESRDDIIREGDRPEYVNLILTGWACRYRALEDGRRQIMRYFIPGDFCDMRIFVLRRMDHSIGAVTTVTLAQITPETIMELTHGSSRVARALWWSALVGEATEREWIVNLGQRSAFERLGHLFCELFIRLQAIGMTEGTTCEMPMTQVELGETTGLSTVHVNRTLQELRGAGLLVLRGKLLTIPDLAALQRAVLFNPDYLHLNHEGAHLDAGDDEV